MEPRDRSSDLVSGAACAACGRPVSDDRVRVLASREDVAFAEVPCEECGSVSLAIFARASDELAADTLPPVGPDDVLDMHAFLASWTGDLRTLVDPPRSGRGHSDGAA